MPRSSKRVERDVLGELRSRGALAESYEGVSIRVLIALCAHEVLNIDRLGLLEASVVEWPQCDRARPGLESQVKKALSSATRRRLQRAFRILHPGSLTESHYPEVTESLLCALLDALGTDRLAALAAFFLENPYAHRSGWPDITAVMRQPPS